MTAKARNARNSQDMAARLLGMAGAPTVLAALSHCPCWCKTSAMPRAGRQHRDGGLTRLAALLHVIQVHEHSGVAVAAVALAVLLVEKVVCRGEAWRHQLGEAGQLHHCAGHLARAHPQNEEARASRALLAARRPVRGAPSPQCAWYSWPGW